MQAFQQDLNDKTAQFVRRMPFLKAIMLTELGHDLEVFRWLSNDLQLKAKIDDNFMTGLRGGINVLFTDFKQ